MQRSASFCTHPSVSWLRIDETRLQVRVPSGLHVTFDQHSGFIEEVLGTLRRPTTLAELCERYPGDAELVTELSKFLCDVVVLAPGEAAASEGVVMNMLDYFARLTKGARSKIAEPFLAGFEVLGTGFVADRVRQLLEQSSPLAPAAADGAMGQRLLVACSDAENIPQFRAANALALEARRPVTFISFNGMQLAVGPCVVPGETACYECCIGRRISNSRFPDEARAQLAGPPTAAAEFQPDALFEALLGFAAGRHLAALARGMFQIVAPGELELWDPITGKHSTSRVLKVPRCTACGRKGAAHPPRAIRDLC